MTGNHHLGGHLQVQKATFHFWEVSVIVFQGRSHFTRLLIINGGMNRLLHVTSHRAVVSSQEYHSCRQHHHHYQHILYNHHRRRRHHS